jgi:hypothetical protein
MVYFSYVSAMVPVKTNLEYDYQQNVAVLFSECLNKSVFIARFNINVIFLELWNAGILRKNKLTIPIRLL